MWEKHNVDGRKKIEIAISITTACQRHAILSGHPLLKYSSAQI